MTETLGTSQGVSPCAPESPRTTLSPGVNELSVNKVNGVNNNDIMTDRDRTSISTASTPDAPSTNNTNKLGEVNVNNVNLFEDKCEALIGSKVPVEIKAWLQSLSRETGETVSQIVRRILTAAYHGQRALTNFQAPTVILNYKVAKAEAKPIVNLGEYLARKELDDLLAKVNRLKERAEREKRVSDMPVTFTVEQAKKLEEAIKKTLKELKSKSLDPEKLQEVEAALSILKSIREGRL